MQLQIDAEKSYGIVLEGGGAKGSYQIGAWKALEEAGVPLLMLEGDCMDASIDPCSTVTKIASFVEALNLKRYGNIFGKLS